MNESEPDYVSEKEIIERSSEVELSHLFLNSRGALGYVLAAAPAFMCVINVLYAANWNPEVVLTIGRTLSIPAIAFNSFVFLLPYVIGAVLLPLLYVHTLDHPTHVNRLVQVSALALFVLGMVAIPAVYCICAAVGIWSILRIKKDFIRNFDPDVFVEVVAVMRDRTVTNAVYFLGAMIVVAAPAAQVMWLPAEVIEMKDGKGSVGYVLEAGDHDLIVLHESTRITEIFRADNVAGRHYCSLWRDDLDRHEAMARENSPWSDDGNLGLYVFHKYKAVNYRLAGGIDRRSFLDIFIEDASPAGFARCSQLGVQAVR